jgi:hypothetical protein
MLVKNAHNMSHIQCGCHRWRLGLLGLPMREYVLLVAAQALGCMHTYVSCVCVLGCEGEPSGPCIVLFCVLPSCVCLVEALHVTIHSQKYLLTKNRTGASTSVCVTLYACLGVPGNALSLLLKSSFSRRFTAWI